LPFRTSAADIESAALRFEHCLQEFTVVSAQTMTKPHPSVRRLLRLREAAQYLSLSPWKLRHIIQSGGLPIVKYNENAPWLLDMRDLDGWVERNKRLIQ
jgi:hypothetical protein